MKKNMPIFLLILSLAGTSLFAQSGIQASIHFKLGSPQGEFAEEVENLGFGLGGNFLYNFPQTPFLLGASAGFLIYGSETRQAPFSLTIPDVTVDVTTSNNIFQGHLLLRAQPQQGAFRPYIDGLLGFNYLWTETTIRSENLDIDENVASSTNFSDGAFCYGGGGGVMIRVYDGTQKPLEPGESRIAGVFIDFGVRYLKGGEAEYLKKGDVERTDEGKVIYNPSQSTTDLLNFNLGVTLAF
ncbi:hypothetical protein JW992_01855 [candidate division KSB1 bacterium]|nr:hypothetical protein [candidate division KSB1 bacterium]